jgi:hypothetical protein
MLQITAAKGDGRMKKIIVSGMALAGLLSLGIGHAQTVGQDMHDAGHDTAHASRTVAHKTVRGTKVATRDTEHGTRVAAHKTANVSREGYHKTANGTKHVVHRMDGKPSTN